MKPVAIVGRVVAFIVAMFAIDWVVEGQNFLLYQFWAPKKEAVRREIYEQTKSFKKGSADRLSALCGQLSAAAEGQQAMLRAQISQEFSDLNTGDAPDYLRPCLSSARQ